MAVNENDLTNPNAKPVKQIRKRILTLLDTHEDDYKKCEGCKTCDEIRELSEQIQDTSSKGCEKILAKGMDMTKSDIAFLMDNKVGVKHICEAIGLPKVEFNEMMINYGFITEKKSKGKTEVKNNKKSERGNKEMAMTNITLEEFVRLSHIEGKTMKEIAEIKGAERQSLYSWKYSNKEKIKAIVDTMDVPVKEEVKTSKPKIKLVEKHSEKIAPVPVIEFKPKLDIEQGTKKLEVLFDPKYIEMEGKVDELTKLYADSQEKLNQYQIVLEAKERDILLLQSKIKEANNLHAACDDLEMEISNLQKELVRKRKEKEEALQNSKTSPKYEKEIKALKELLSLYLMEGKSCS